MKPLRMTALVFALVTGPRRCAVWRRGCRKGRNDFRFGIRIDAAIFRNRYGTNIQARDPRTQRCPSSVSRPDTLTIGKERLWDQRLGIGNW